MATGFVQRFKGKIKAYVAYIGGGGIIMGGPMQFAAAGGLIATGTNLATALPLVADINDVVTVAANTGVSLPAAIAGRSVTIFNAGANPLAVYSIGTDTVDGGASVTLTNAKRCEYICFAAGAWISAQLGLASA
jgi:hypothetical protein